MAHAIKVNDREPVFRQFLLRQHFGAYCRDIAVQRVGAHEEKESPWTDRYLGRGIRILQWMLWIVLLILAGNAWPQQSYDFLLARTSYVPEANEYSFASTQDYSNDEIETRWRVEPGFLFGLTDTWAIEVRSHFESPRGESFRYQSSSVTSINRWTPRYSRLSIGSAFDYRYARTADDNNRWRLTGLASYVGKQWKTVFNLGAEHPMGESTVWDYALGARRSVSERASLGVETRGTLNSHRAAEGLAALYLSPTPALTFNVGVGAELGGMHDLAFRSAIVYRTW